jgi:nucleoid DNA-binding protein
MMAVKGFKKLVLIPALREQGLSVRKARAVIDAVFGSIKDALSRHECVELPIGSFNVVRNPEKQRSWRFGENTTLYARRYRVVFLASAELELAAAAAPPSPPPPKRTKQKTRKKKRVGSELTISTELIVEFLRKNVAAGRWHLYFKFLSEDYGPFIADLLERNRPKLSELRPLDEAFIDECAPKEMPETHPDHFTTRLEWFVF